MEIKLIKRPKCVVVGREVSSSYDAEQAVSTAKLPITREKVINVKSSISNVCKDDRIFSVYNNYIFTDHGAYDVCVGYMVTKAEKLPDNFVAAPVPESCYISFTSQPGQLPQISQDSWHFVWDYFSEKDEKYIRTYKNDIEALEMVSKDTAIVTIYISVEHF